MERFRRRINEYRGSLYNETELRNEFVNPFFAALGWDIDNRQDLSSDLKEVKVEESIRVEESIKSPDYSFRLGRKLKFFVETKKPSINIEGGVYPAFQLRRYAWSASLSLSILTDFEEFAVYDCRAEPKKIDKPGKGRLLYLQYDQYVERWDEIAALFSKESVLAGSLDKYIQTIPEKRGIKRVDAALLDEISQWREALAGNLARRNPHLSQSDLNFSVQRTIDRLLFLRICEDRAIEEYGRLKALLQEDGVYARLMEIFREADQRYNSGIFHFQEERDRAELPDSLTGALVLDDATLKEIIQDLYFPDSPYVFSEIPAEILGQVYEQFLGKVIRLEEGHRAVVEDKPEVRKAGGVYYTPSYIVEYIVKNTVGRLLEGKSAAQAAEIRILDPACGSGSFLIGAYQFLLDWHLQSGQAHCRPGGPGGCSRIQRQRRRVASDHFGEKAYLAEHYLRGGHRQPGGGGDQALPSAQGAGGREPGEHQQPAALFQRAGFAGSGGEYQVRQLAHRLRLL
ncbi:MAG: type II site-specific deoxyribonuclease [Methanosaeta sp. NSM2]|nr:MAG: type II site-specific deoxyribonuclease [Methanosaeta sp. NSM2]